MLPLLAKVECGTCSGMNVIHLSRTNSSSLLRALVILIQSRSHHECSSDTYKMGPFKTKAVFFVSSFFDKFEPMREFYNPNI